MNLEAALKSFHSRQTQEIRVVVDEDNRLLAGTEYFAYLLNLSSINDILGKKSDQVDAPSIVYSSNEFQRQHKKVISLNKPIHMIDIHTYRDGIKTLYTQKHPIENQDGSVTSVLTWCHELDRFPELSKKVFNSLSKFHIDKMPISISLELIDRFDMINLSKRQSECYYYILRGYSNADISNILFISKRTVDFHCEKIKDTLGLQKRTEMIEYGIILRLLRYIPKSLISSLTR